jgi:branched-chain amino acid transport system substrate-binding protein
VFTPALLNPARTEISCKSAGLPSASELRPTRTNNFFRLTTTDNLQGAAAADFAFLKLHLLRAAVVSDHEAYGQGLAYAFTSRFVTLGGTILGRTDLDAQNPDARPFLMRMRDAGAQAIYFGGAIGGCEIPDEIWRLFQGSEQTPLLGGDGIAGDPACVASAGPNTQGIYATLPIVDGDSQPSATATIREFKQRFGSTADYGPYTLLAYDATAVLYAALDRAIRAARGRLPARADVTQEVARTSDLAGATGALGFDPAGDTTNRIVSIYRPAGIDPRAPWKLVDSVDYRARLPY